MAASPRAPRAPAVAAPPPHPDARTLERGSDSRAGQLSFCTKVCYGIGGIPNQVASSATAFYLQLFLLDVAQGAGLHALHHRGLLPPVVPAPLHQPAGPLVHGLLLPVPGPGHVLPGALRGAHHAPDALPEGAGLGHRVPDDHGDGGDADGSRRPRAHRVGRPRAAQVRGARARRAGRRLPRRDSSLLHCSRRACSDLPCVHWFALPRGEGATRLLRPSLRPRPELPGWAGPHCPAPALPEAGDLLPVHLSSHSGGAELPGPVLYTCLPATRSRPGRGADHPGLSCAEHPTVGVGSTAIREEDISLRDLCDGAFCNPVGCCTHSTCGICGGLCVWPEHCCVLAATLVHASRCGRCLPEAASAWPGPGDHLLLILCLLHQAFWRRRPGHLHSQSGVCGLRGRSLHAGGAGGGDPQGPHRGRAHLHDHHRSVHPHGGPRTQGAEPGPHPPAEPSEEDQLQPCLRSDLVWAGTAEASVFRAQSPSFFSVP